jgi:hypothetical protein
MTSPWRTRGPTCALIIGGALASIATSKISGWARSEQQDLQPLVLDNATTSVRYRLHAELHGPDPFEGLDGNIETFVYVKARAPSGAIATIELHSLTHPDIAPTIADVTVTSPEFHYVAIDAWLACETDPCSEDFELIVHRDATADLPAIEISGWVEAYAQGTPAQIPAGTSVVITATAAP